MAELRDRLDAPVHLCMIARTSLRLGQTVTKKVLQAAERDRSDVRHKRACWRGQSAKVAVKHFVFLDETGTNTSMTRLYGRAPRGQCLVDKVPQENWQQTTLVAGSRSDGVLAPFVVEGARDAATFEGEVEQVLVPRLRPGDIVVLDRLSSHRDAAVRRAVQKAGASVWYLPPYSPDYNPIEQMWAKVKALLRQVKARTTAALWDALGEALTAVTPEDCLNGFLHCGYHATPICEAL